MDHTLTDDEQLALSAIADRAAEYELMTIEEIDALPIDCSGESMVSQLYSRNLISRVGSAVSITRHGWVIAYRLLLQSFTDAATWETSSSAQGAA